jgi:hypothetical protein
LRLGSSSIGESAASALTADDPINTGPGFTVAYQHNAGRLHSGILARKLLRRVNSYDPSPVSWDMDETIELQDEMPNGRRRRNVIIGGSLAVLVVGVVATSALGAESPARRVDVKAPTTATLPHGSEAPDTTVASSTLAPATSSEQPVTATPEPPAGPTVEQQIGQTFTTLFDPDATDEQRLAVIDNSSDLEPVMQAARAHPMYKELGNTTVTVERIDFSDLWSAYVTLRYSHPMLGWMNTTGRVVLVAGVWKVDRGSFCDGLATLTNAAGGPTLNCDEILNPPTTTTSTTEAPTTTSTTLPSTTSTTAP